MRTSLHHHKAITGSVAALALALAWVIPATTAGADPSETPGGGIDVDAIPVEVEGRLLFTYYDSFEGEEASGHTEASVLLDDGRAILVDEDVTEEDGLTVGASIEATLLIPAETAEALPSGEKAELAALVEEAAPAPASEAGIEPLSVEEAVADDLLTAAADSGELVPLASGYYVVVAPYEPPTAADFSRTFDVAIINRTGEQSITRSQVDWYVEQLEQYWSDQTGRSFNFTVNDVRAAATTVPSVATDAELNQIWNEAAALYGHMSPYNSEVGYSAWYNNNKGKQLWVFVSGIPGETGSAVTKTLGEGIGSGGVVATYQGQQSIVSAQSGAMEQKLLVSVSGHELGHVFGLGHATARICPNAPTTATWDESALGTCTLPESNQTGLDYRDHYSIMGGGFVVNQTLKYELGLLAASDQVVIDSAAANQTVTLRAPRSSQGAAVLVVSSPGSQVDYTFEFEVHPGDFNYGSLLQLTGGDGVRVMRLDSSHRTYFHEETSGGSTRLPVGQTFVSADGRVRVTLVSQSETQAVLSVTREAGPDVWARFTPKISSQSAYVGGGGWAELYSNVSEVSLGVATSDSAWLTVENDGLPIFSTWNSSVEAYVSTIDYDNGHNAFSATARHGIITVPVYGEGGQTVVAEFHVFQGGTATPVTVTVSESTVGLTAASGSSGSTVVVASQGYWWIDESTLPDWLSVSSWWGVTGQAAVFVAKSANTSSSARTASVEIYSPASGQATVAVTQSAQGSTLAVTIPPVSITGDATVGYTLQAVVGETTPSNASKYFQWYRGSTDIPGATGSQYILTAADAGQQVKVRVTASASGYTTATRDSDPVTVAAATLSLSREALSVPAAGETSTITVSTNQSSWSPVSSDTSWLTVSKSGSTLTVTAAVNTSTSSRTGTVTVTAGTATAKTVTVTQLGQSLVTIPPVSITGDATVGYTLQAVVGETTPSNASKYFQWYRGSTDIPGATGSQYTLTTADAGQQVKVRVTASASGYTTATRDSDPVTVGPATLYVGFNSGTTSANAGGVNVTVMTNQPSWDVVSSDPTWLRVTPHDGYFTLFWYANTSSSSRTATVTVSAGVATPVSFTLTQSGVEATLSASPTDVPVGQASGSVSAAITVTTNQSSWDATSNTTWLTVTKSTSSFTVRVTSANTTAVERTGTVTVTAGSAAPVMVVVTQAPRMVSTLTVTVSGTPTVGQVLRVTVGATTPASSKVYQWLRGGVAIPGATGSSYTLTAADAGQQVKVRVTASASGYQAAVAESSPLMVAAASLSVSADSLSFPSAAGSQVVSVSTNQSAWAVVSNATSWLTVSKSATGFTVRVTANATATARTGTVTVSAGGATPVSVTVTQEARTPVVVSGVSVTGTAAVGQVLTATVGVTTPTVSTKTYRWYRGVTAISGATAYRYTLTAADAGQLVKCVVTANASGYAAGVAESVPVMVAAAQVSVSPSFLSLGSPASAVTLVVTTNQTTWTVTDNVSWLTATKSGGGVSVTVTANTTAAARSGTITVSAGTAPKVTVAVTQAAPAPVVVPEVMVSGTATVGYTLTAEVGEMTPSAAAKTYRWYRGATAIGGATQSTYKLVAADAGKQVSVRVTGTASGYTATTRESVSVYVLAAQLSVSSKTVSVGAPVGSQSAVVGVVTNQSSWSVRSNVTWLQVAQVGDGFQVSVLVANPSQTAARSGTLTVSGGVASSVTVTVTQVAPSPVVFTSLVVTGTPLVGSTLSASVVTVPVGAVLTFRWYRGATAISGATGSQYVVKAADVGKQVTVRVTATAPGYKTVTQASSGVMVTQ